MCWPKFLNSPTGISDLNGQENLSVMIYPNPATDILTIELEQPMEKWDWTLYNIHGQVVLELRGLSGDKLTIDRGTLATGLYTYQLKTADGPSVSVKITIEDRP